MRMVGFGAVASYGRSDTGGLLSSQALIAFVPTTRLDRARAFYAFVLGLGLVEDTPGALVFDAGGTMLNVLQVRTFAPAPYAVVGWLVEDIVGARRGLIARGVECQPVPRMAAEPDGICTAPSGLRSIWFRDADTNLLSLMQLPPR
jgi:catechol 2,3-dioxygenase-like lactoylglutathione lyase family enzyme